MTVRKKSDKKRSHILFNGSGDTVFATRLRNFIKHQAASWQELNHARNHLKHIQTRRVMLNHLDVTLQHNPKRIKSTSSKVDTTSIEQRACFICTENLYPMQKALPYKTDWLILCNPFPIFDDHLVVSHNTHCPQRILPAIEAMTSFVKETGFAFTAFFNGADAGASAPDHCHFQACPAGSIPIERQIAGLVKSGSPLLSPLPGEPPGFAALLDERAVFICISEDPAPVNRFIEIMCRSLQQFSRSEGEPSVNVIVSGYRKGLTAILFPRRTHRPACYYETGDAQILVSPGAVDVGGLIIMPRETDFLSIDPKTVLDIFKQVCLDDEPLKLHGVGSCV